MNKAELVAKMAEGAELTKAQVDKALNSFIAVTATALKSGDKITLIGFDTFSAVHRAARIGPGIHRPAKKLKLLPRL